MEDYSGGRDLDSFIKFLNEKCETNRLPSGSLAPNVGRDDQVDSSIRSYIQSSYSEEAKKSFEETLKVRESSILSSKKPYISKTATFYKKIMEKFHKAHSFASKEIKRLNKILEGGNLEASKNDDFVVRKNILNVFLGYFFVFNLFSEETADDNHSGEL